MEMPDDLTASVYMESCEGISGYTIGFVLADKMDPLNLSDGLAFEMGCLQFRHR
jgi:hypothetical protein